MLSRALRCSRHAGEATALDAAGRRVCFFRIRIHARAHGRARRLPLAHRRRHLRGRRLPFSHFCPSTRFVFGTSAPPQERSSPQTPVVRCGAPATLRPPNMITPLASSPTFISVGRLGNSVSSFAKDRACWLGPDGWGLNVWRAFGADLVATVAPCQVWHWHLGQQKQHPASSRRPSLVTASACFPGAHAAHQAAPIALSLASALRACPPSAACSPGFAHSGYGHAVVCCSASRPQ